MPRPHQDRHPTFVEGCFGCKLLTIHYGRPPTPQSRMEQRWQQDMPAYKRLRADGLQPKSIDDCATLERHADNQLEVEMGHLFTKAQMPVVQDIMDATGG